MISARSLASLVTSWRLDDIMVRGGAVDSTGGGAAGGAALPCPTLVHFSARPGYEIQPLFGTAFTNRRLYLRNNIVGLWSFRAGKFRPRFELPAAPGGGTPKSTKVQKLQPDFQEASLRQQSA